MKNVRSVPLWTMVLTAALLSAAVHADKWAVEQGDTLWSIARQTRPPDVSVHEQVQRIYALNGSVFANGDLAVLRAGTALILPTNEARRAAQRPASPPTGKHRAGCDRQVAMTIIRGTSMQEATVARQCNGSSGGR